MNDFNSLDDFMESVCSKDTSVRLDVYARLEEYLRDEYTSVVNSSDLGKFCEAILAWISSSNFRVSINGLTIIQLLVQRLPEPMRNFSIEIAIIILDRVVDNKEQVRFAAKNILLFMMASYGPSYMWDKLMAGFNHKLPKVREETLDLLEETFHKFGGNNLPISKLLTCVVKLLGDQNQQVRDKSLITIIEMYKYTGERLRNELYKKQLPDAKLKLIIYKFDEVLRKGELVNFVVYDEGKANQSLSNNTNLVGAAVETVSHLPPPTTTNTTNTMSHSSSAKPPQKAAAVASAMPNSKSNQGSIGSSHRDQPEYRSVRMPRSTSLARAYGGAGSTTNLEYIPHQRSASSAKSDGALSESAFYEGFEGVPKINVYSSSDLQDRLRKIAQALSNMNPEFINVRMEAVPTLRSILVSCRSDRGLLDEYFTFIKQLHEPLKNQLKDLRSTMVRQVTQTVCLWAETWPDKMDIYLESWLPCFIGFLPNSAKVMSSNAVIAIRFLYQNVRSARLIPCLLESLAHKNPMVRRHMIENLTLIVTGWGIELIDKYSKQMITAIVKLVSDPEAATREHARETFWEFYKLYPELARTSVSKLDGKIKSVLEDHSTEVIGHKVMFDQSSGPSRTATRPPPVAASTSSNSLKRSTSAVDLKNSLSRSNSIVSKNEVIHKIKANEPDILAQSELDNLDLLKPADDDEFTFDLASKSQLLFMASNNITNDVNPALSTTSSRNNSISTSNKLTTGSRIPVTNFTTNTPRYLNNTPSRIPTSTNPSPNKSRIAQSQPGSRSTSPTPKYSYLTHFTNNAANQQTLLDSSSHQQHQRYLDMSTASNAYYFNDFTDSLASVVSGTSTTTPSTKQAIVSRYNQHFMNSTSRSGGSALGTAKANRLAASSRNSSRESSPGRRSSYSERRISLSKTTTPGRNLFQINRQMSNTPDCEKVFSKKQFIRGSRRWDDSDEASETSSICSERSFSSSIGGARITEDINEAIALLSSTQWSERRDGLENIKKMMQSSRVFTRQEIKRLRDVFLRLFSDQHTKVFSIFLDTLNMFITIYREHLTDWLFVLLTRLLIKQGGENLSTVNKKILACLDTVRTSFTIELQFKTLITFIKDSSIQQSNFKVKIAVLSYLQVLLLTMKSSDLHANEDLKQALIRIVGLSGEPKSFELRKSAQSVLIALYNLNAPECSFLFGQLPQDLHATAIKVVKDHMKNLRMEDEHASKSSSPKQVLSAFNLEYMSKTSYLNDYVNNLGNGGAGDDNQTVSSGSSSGLQLSHVIKDIQNLSMHSNFNAYLSTNGKETRVNVNVGVSKNDEILSKDSGVQSNGDVDSDSDGAVSSTTSHSTINLPDMTSILAKLDSNTSSASGAEKIRAMKELTELIRTGNRPEYKWSENFNKVLVCLLNYLDTTVGNENAPDQALAIQTLYAMHELLQFHYKEFNTYIELTVRKLIDRYRDSPPNEQTKLVEEVIYTAAKCLPAEPCVNYLRPVIETGDYPKNLMSIKMMQKCIQHMSGEVCKKLMGDMIRSLLISWDNKESPVRRQSVLCIVDIYLVAGDSLKEHLTQLSSSKMKLLNVYINRRFEENASKQPVA